MLLNKKFVRLNKVNISIFIFVLAFLIIHLIKPDVIYNKEGGFRPFGLGYKHKTIIPIWLVAIILAIFSYLLVFNYCILMK